MSEELVWGCESAALFPRCPPGPVPGLVALVATMSLSVVR